MELKALPLLGRITVNSALQSPTRRSVPARPIYTNHRARIPPTHPEPGLRASGPRARTHVQKRFREQTQGFGPGPAALTANAKPTPHFYHYLTHLRPRLHDQGEQETSKGGQPEE